MAIQTKYQSGVRIITTVRTLYIILFVVRNVRRVNLEACYNRCTWTMTQLYSIIALYLATEQTITCTANSVFTYNEKHALTVWIDVSIGYSACRYVLAISASQL